MMVRDVHWQFNEQCLFVMVYGLTIVGISIQHGFTAQQNKRYTNTRCVWHCANSDVCWTCFSRRVNCHWVFETWLIFCSTIRWNGHVPATMFINPLFCTGTTRFLGLFNRFIEQRLFMVQMWFDSLILSRASQIRGGVRMQGLPKCQPSDLWRRTVRPHRPGGIGSFGSRFTDSTAIGPPIAGSFPWPWPTWTSQASFFGSCVEM